MYYNQLNQWNEIPMPLLMAFTTPEPIQEIENEVSVTYDPVYQIVYDMRTIGTRSLKTSVTKVGGSHSGMCKHDKKNEIDDSKNVK